MSEKTIYRFFKENLGESPFETLTNFRVNKAKVMLKNSNTSIIVIAENCGFGTENTFYRNFKKSTNTTPNKYRTNGITIENNPNIQGYLAFNSFQAKKILKEYITNI